MVLQTRNYGRAALALLFALAASLHAQGILTVTPSRTITTTAGTGILGYTGNGGVATSATVADPSGVAYDQSGNLYFADARNHVVREISNTGTITVIVGTGLQGYGGDGAPATSAYLDTPTGIAVDLAGNIYVADSHNHCIREISRGVITTIAGTSVPGFSGDGATATAAQLWLPSAVAVDSSGNVYIADTNNHRVRKITKGTISTIAGDGEELFSGDGGAATSAALDSPTGVAVDASGNVYIADRHNQRVRMIAGSTITTVAGSGAEGFSGDGSAPTAATLAMPSGVSVDALGNLFIADTDNQRIRELGGAAINTIAGSGQQGYGIDGTIPASVNLNSPRAVAADAFGNFAISDRLNQLVRTAALPVLAFSSANIGILSPAQSVTLANTGSSSISVATIAFAGAFTTAPGGTCSALPITLAANASCTQSIAFLPTTTGPATGSVVFSGAGIVPQTFLLTGNAAQGSQTATVALTSSLSSPFVGQAITFTATVTPADTPSGSVSFYDGTNLIGAAQTLVAGSASITVATLASGAHNVTAVYSGDANFLTESSAVLVQNVFDFNFTLGAGSPNGVPSQTVEPGHTATFAFNLASAGVPLPFPVMLSATGLPPGATATFTPNPITIGSGGVSFTMSVQIPATTGSLRYKSLFGGGTIALGLLLLPFSRRFRRLRALSLCATLLLGFALTSGIAGCGGGFSNPSPQTYTIHVIATVTGTGGIAQQRSTTVMLTVQ